jgi:predicted dehydrogenase
MMLNVAIQGAGNVSTEHIKAYQNNPHTRVVAIGSRTLEGAKKKAAATGVDCAVYDNYEELLKHPGLDIISICTPPHLHAQECIRAAESGIHVLVEKPVALNQEDVEAMAAAVRKAGVKSAVGFVLRWNPLILTIKKAVSDGWVGQPLLVQADYWHGPQNLRPAGVQRSWEVLAGGAMVQGGCHAMDAARYVLGNERIARVSAVCPEAETKAAKQQTTVSTVTFAGGAVGKVSAGQRFYMPYVFNIEVFGDEGSIRNNRFYSKQWPGQHDFLTLPTIVPESGDVDHHPFRRLIDHLVECIQTDTESHNSLEVAINTHAACFAAEHSAAHGSVPVTLS